MKRCGLNISSEEIEDEIFRRERFKIDLTVKTWGWNFHYYENKKWKSF